MEKQSETTKNLPYFKFYPTDFLLGIAYMSNAEVGAYIKLLCYQWNKGFLPNDHNILESLSGGMTDNVLDKFVLEGNVWKNKRLEKEREVYIEKCNTNKNSAKIRWNKDANALPTHCERNAKYHAKDYAKSMPSQKSEVRSQKSETREQNLEAIEIINYLNSVCGTNYKTSALNTINFLKLRLKEGFTVNDFKIVIDKKFNDWSKKPEMVKFLRPITLFGTKFESYLNEKEVKRFDFGEEEEFIDV